METYPSTNYLENLKEVLSVYVGVMAPDESTKQKRDALIQKTYKENKEKVHPYSLQLEAISVIGKVEMSHLLGCNEFVVPHMVEEYAQLKLLAQKLTPFVKKMDQFDEVKRYSEAILKEFTGKNLSLSLYDDLKHLEETHGVEIDFKECMDKYKATKISV